MTGTGCALTSSGSTLQRSRLDSRQAAVFTFTQSSHSPDMPSGTARVIEMPFDGQQLFEAAERHRLEGVVSKRKTAPYRSMSTSSISTACPPIKWPSCISKLYSPAISPVAAVLNYPTKVSPDLGLPATLPAARSAGCRA
jgi:hypothetical protein